MGSQGQVEVAGTTQPQSSRGRREENTGQRTGDRGQGTQDREKRTQNTGQREEARGQRTQGTKQITIKMCIPTRVVGPTVTSTAGFLRTNITRMNSKETPACPVVTYASIVSIFTLILYSNVQH